MNSLTGIKNQLVHKRIQHLHVFTQAMKISEIRLYYLGYVCPSVSLSVYLSVLYYW